MKSRKFTGLNIGMNILINKLRGTGSIPKAKTGERTLAIYWKHYKFGNAGILPITLKQNLPNPSF